ncbi:aspartate dehydrogenase [Afifella pfennigii]|uniref:aspartate dehydrogenase n=1 Tax=Afifella pfennigii TaxID=209897 RepID=UPI00055445EE|nr:aspartate dehydrogenase [Afifella pfennigii]
MTGPAKVAVAGLGAIGSKVAAALDAGLPGLKLVAVAAGEEAAARRLIASFREEVPILALGELAGLADIVVECLPPELFAELAGPTLAAGRTLIAASAGALLANEALVKMAAAHGGRIVVPSGALAGLDGLSAAAEAGLLSVRLVTRKPLRSLAQRVEVGGETIDLRDLAAPKRLYAGSVREAVAAFPVNVNVAASVAFAGLGPEQTQIEVWADPGASRNRHTLFVTSRAGAFTVEVENLPDPANPKTSSLTAYSLIACLRRLRAPFAVGS